MKTNCPDCGSSDALHVYEDHTYCYSCGKHKFTNETIQPEKSVMQDFVEVSTVKDIANYQSFPLKSRGITKRVVDHFQVKMSVNEEGKPRAHHYPFTKNGQIVAYKERALPKQFSTVGDFKEPELFGQNVAQGSKKLIITEGELDTMAVAQAFLDRHDRIYPVVSLPNGAQSVKAILNNLDFVRSFEEVILMFDMDEPGRAAVNEAARMIGVGKAKIAKLPEKDPCDVLKTHGGEAIIQAIYGAQTWSPAGIVTGEAIWEQFKKRQDVESIPYPDCLGGLNAKLDGIRHGEITLFTSGTGSGKSTVIKEIILDLLDKTDDKVGLISLEESVGDTAEKFISMAIGRSLVGDPPITDEELRSGYEKVFADERLVLLDHQGSVSDDSLLDKIEYMALMGCKYLVLDHITIAVSEGAEGRTGNEAVDKVMSDLLKIVKQHNVWLGLISHLRKAGGDSKSFEEGRMASIDDIKGSGSIKQISFDIIAFARNLMADTEEDRCKIDLAVLKSRFTGRTGSAGAALYNPITGRLKNHKGSIQEAKEGLTKIELDNPF